MRAGKLKKLLESLNDDAIITFKYGRNNLVLYSIENHIDVTGTNAPYHPFHSFDDDCHKVTINFIEGL